MASLSGASRRRGFTLLELLLASATLASIALLGTALWTQSSAASESAQQRDRGLQLQRIGSMIRGQWSHRRALHPVGDDERSFGGAVMSSTGVEFTTAQPILFRDEALVTVRYEWVTEDGLRFDLRYLERPVRAFGSESAAQDGAGADEGFGGLDTRQIVLLEGCDAIGVERFGGPASSDEPEQDGDEADPDERRWWAFDSTQPVDSDALRLSVRWRGEEAVWVFVARPSR